jgi:hypothetical protein
MKDHVPSLSTVVDVLQARIDYAEEQNLVAEQRVMKQAREIIVDYVLRDERQLSLVREILRRIRVRQAGRKDLR